MQGELKLTGDEVRAIIRAARNRGGPSDPAEGMDYVAATLEYLSRRADRQRAGVPEGENAQKFVLMSRPGMCVVQKGPFRDRQMIEEMVRGLYDLYPDATCIVADMPYNGSANDGREWVAMYGDRRRKKLAAAPTPPAGDAERDEPYVEITVRIGEAVSRKVATKVEFERSHYPEQMATYLAGDAIDAAMATSEKGGKERG